uniref:Uncharacterized protein n=1 Tax=Quercus lobata TaxID=97700 RepID=A0A7N2MU22_QUELO
MVKSGGSGFWGILQIFFDAPKGDDPIALNLSSMGKVLLEENGGNPLQISLNTVSIINVQKDSSDDQIVSSFEDYIEMESYRYSY